MKNIKFIRTFFVLALGSLITLSSCDALLDDTKTDFGQGPILAQFENTTDELNIILDPAVTSIDYMIPITFFGGKNVPLDRDVTVTIATSPDSQAQEGVEFELGETTFTIPAGQKTANAAIIVLTGNLVPFDFKDIVLEIVESSEAVSDVNSIALTLKALPETTLAGTYDVEIGQYWNSGSRQGDFGGTVSIQAVSPDLYKHVGIGFWPDDNDFYFTVDPDTNVITVLDVDLAGEPTLLNGSPIMTCAKSVFEMIICDDTTNKQTLMSDGSHIVELTTGYDRGTGATREFLEKLVRQN
ncbi:hypothetical protein [Algibacter sp. L1A34]|uniref:hypothetical protein n=1 Tax=Algibacter sp. L1A34 TaxID=2686365 RepID=UPI00131AACEE|nr:hypothetical protein [Algibacter sp. L1A34]